MTKYFDASSISGNADELFRFMKFAQFPSFSRLFPESFDRHLKIYPTMLVANQPITDQKELDTMAY